MTDFKLKGKELRVYTVKKFGKTSAHVILPKKSIGQTIKVVFEDKISA